MTTTEYLEHWTPGGSQTASKAPGRAGPRGGFPATLERAIGPWVYGEDGKAYLDFVASLAAVALGHVHQRVVEAVTRELHNGALLSLPTKLEGQASEMLCEITGWAEQARWVKTGSEATEAAIRIARAATGRKKILTVRAGYHSWHSWFQAVKPEHPGVPTEYENLIVGFDYGEPIQRMWHWGDRKWWSQFAAVILEPVPLNGIVGNLVPSVYVGLLAECAREFGALVIFDEVVWGFRLAKAGAGVGYCGLTPDLACYGKALGNGVPVAAVVGRRELMQHARLVSGTFGGDRLGLAAAVAVMQIYNECDDVIQQLWRTGKELQQQFNHHAERFPQLRAEMRGFPPHPVITFEHPLRVEIMSLFLQEMAERGVLLHASGGLNIMQAHLPEHIDAAGVAIERSLFEVDRALEHGQEGLRGRLLGEPYELAFARR